MDTCKTLSRDYIDLFVIPEWSLTKDKKDISDKEILEIKALAIKRGIKVVNPEFFL